MSIFHDNILQTIKKYNLIQNNDCIVVGLSGGADSCALLHVLSVISRKLNIKLVAAHLNHCIRREEAQRDQDFSGEFAKRCNVPFVTKNIDVPQYAKQNKISEEMAGRRLRYEFFDEVCKQYGCNKIAVAHNKNDCVETIFLNLIRGTGSAGLEGIKAKNGNIIRPLIEVLRQDIETYAKENNIFFMTDSTNLSDEYSRNIIRNKVLPEISKINPGALNNILRSSEIISLENEFAEDILDKENLFSIYEHEVLIDRVKFQKLHRAMSRRAVLKGIKILCGNSLNVSSKQVVALCDNLKTGNVYEFGNGAFAIISSKSIILTKTLPESTPYEYKVLIPGTVKVEETGCEYKFEYVTKYQSDKNSISISLDGLDESKICLRSRKDGDAFIPFGMSGLKKIKNFFIDNKIPSYQRDNYPLLVCGKEICAVVPLRISENCRIKNDTKKILMITKIGGTYDEQ